MAASSSQSEDCPYPRVKVTAIGLEAGGAAAEACQAIVEQFGLETAVDVLTASTDQEVLIWLADSPAGQSVRPADWSKLVRWASTAEQARKHRIRSMAEEGTTVEVPEEETKSKSEKKPAAERPAETVGSAVASVEAP